MAALVTALAALALDCWAMRAAAGTPGWVERYRLRGHESPVIRIAWSGDGNFLATLDQHGRVVVWDANSRKVQSSKDFPFRTSALAWSPDGKTVAVANRQQGSIDLPADDVDFDYNVGREADDEEAAIEAVLGSSAASVSPGLRAPHQSPLTAATVRFVDRDSGMQVGTLEAPPVNDLAWFPSGQRIAVASDYGVMIFDPYAGTLLTVCEDTEGSPFDAVAVSFDGAHLATSSGPEITVFDGDTGRAVTSAFSEAQELSVLQFHPHKREFAVGTDIGVVDIVSLRDDGETEWHSLEGQEGAVTGLSYSGSGDLLASASAEGAVFLWDAMRWELLATHSGPRRHGQRPAAFTPRGNWIATSGANATAVLLELDLPTLRTRARREETVHYANAKVVLLGDTGVGKSGLGLVLAGKPFEATESTHQRNVYRLSTTVTAGDRPERREVYLWDLAGQPGYRLLHQLHLRDVAVALLVFDARNEDDAFSGVRYWSRALEQAERTSRAASSAPIRRVLVGARTDRGVIRATAEDLRLVQTTYHLDDYIPTSAKEGTGVERLLSRVHELVDWDSLPRGSSTALFDAIREYFLERRSGSSILLSEAELLDGFLQTGVAVSREVDGEFAACLDLLERRGLVRRLSFGGLVLLRPETLDAYAASVVLAAASSTDGLGAIREDAVLAGEFPVPSEVRLSGQKEEQLLLLATVQDLLAHEVALREDSGDGTYLVFPTQSRRALAIDERLQPWCVVEFEGPGEHVWATLIVRLSHSGVFAVEQYAVDGATFRSQGRRFLLERTSSDDGTNRLVISEQGTPTSGGELEAVLEDFVLSHVTRRAAKDTVRRSTVLACGNCGFVMPEALLQALEGQTSAHCPRCGREVGLRREPRRASKADVSRSLADKADRETNRLTKQMTAQGKSAANQFDVFLAHNTLDKDLVIRIYRRLSDEGLNAWLDSEQIPPGRWFQEVIQRAISTVKTAAIFIGPRGIGRWQTLELRSFVSRCVDEDVPVIPVLLPGAKWPEDLLFLKELNAVAFDESIEEIEPFRRLVWGITGTPMT